MYAYNNNYPYHMTYWKYCLGLSPVYGVFPCTSLRQKNICFIRTRFWPHVEEHFFSTDDSPYYSYYTIHVIYNIVTCIVYAGTRGIRQAIITSLLRAVLSSSYTIVLYKNRFLTPTATWLNVTFIMTIPNEVQTRLNNRPDRFPFEIHALKTHYIKHIHISLLMHFFVVYKLHFIVANVNIPESVAENVYKITKKYNYCKCVRFPLVYHWFTIDSSIYRTCNNLNI